MTVKPAAPTPRTEAGRTFRMDWLSEGQWRRDSGWLTDRILAIEAEARATGSGVYDRDLFLRIAADLQRVSRESGYAHPEHFSGPEWPATDVPCLPETIAEQIIEKHLIEATGSGGLDVTALSDDDLFFLRAAVAKEGQRRYAARLQAAESEE